MIEFGFKIRGASLIENIVYLIDGASLCGVTGLDFVEM